MATVVNTVAMDSMCSKATGVACVILMLEARVGMSERGFRDAFAAAVPPGVGDAAVRATRNLRNTNI